MKMKIINTIKRFFTEEDAIGTVEMILILVEILTHRYMYI